MIVDNESDPGKSGTLAEDLILRDEVDMLYSVDSSPSIHIPIAEVAEKHGVPHIVGGGPLDRGDRRAWGRLSQTSTIGRFRVGW